MACSCNIIFSLYLLYAEVYWQLTAGDHGVFLIYRGLVVVLLAVWKFMLMLHVFKESEYFNLTMYSFYGFVILGMHSFIAHHQLEELEDTDNYTFLFHAGRWSLGDAMLFICFCFNSGLLFIHSSGLGGAFTLLYVILPFNCYYPKEEGVLSSYSVVILPIFLCVFIISAHDVEMKLRHRFLMLSDLGHGLRRQDTLIHSILPSDISYALKQGNADKLATYHQDVSILFCSIVGFSTQSSNSHAEDIVKLLIRIVSMFDRIVEHMGVYKVENIADTYLCCDGLELNEDDTHHDHVMRIARTAVAMREAAEYFQWRWSDGSPIQLKIGIHSGPVSGGVIGTKSYSYHLFGDTVNTASRMCSYSIPGQICVSRVSTRQIRQHNKDIFAFRPRGKVNVKGKGDMQLYWLDGYKKHQNSETPAQIYGIDLRKNLSDNIGRFLESIPSDDVIRIGRFDLSYYNDCAADSIAYVEGENGCGRCVETCYYRCSSAALRYKISRGRMALARYWKKYFGRNTTHQDKDVNGDTNIKKFWVRSQSHSSSSSYKGIIARSPSKVEPVCLEEIEDGGDVKARPSLSSKGKKSIYYILI